MAQRAARCEVKRQEGAPKAGRGTRDGGRIKWQRPLVYGLCALCLSLEVGSKE